MSITEKMKSKELINRIGSERSLIGVCLNEPSKLIEAVNEGVTPQMFASESHKFIYMAMAHLIDQGVKPDPVGIMNVYTSEEAKKAMEEAGGTGYIEMLSLQNTATPIQILAGHIKQAAARREVYEQAERTKQLALKDSESDLNSFLGRVENDYRDIAIEYQVATGVQKMGDGLGDHLNDLLRNPRTVVGIKTGWKQYDLASQGLVDGELTVVGARSKVGKSSLILNWVAKITCEDKIPTLYADTEMTKKEQEEKLLSIISGVPHYEIRTGFFGRDTKHGTAQEKIARIQLAVKVIKDAPFYHIEMPDFTIEKVSALARKYQIEKGIQLLCFDYLKLPSSGVFDKEYQALGQLTNGLKALAGTLKIPVLTAVQLNRSAIGNNEMDESSVGGSDRILQLASRLCLLREATEEEQALQGCTHQFKIARQRIGSPLDWQPVYTNKLDWKFTMMEETN